MKSVKHTGVTASTFSRYLHQGEWTGGSQSRAQLLFTTSLPHVHKLRPQNKPHCNKCQIPVRSSLNYRIFPTRPSICKKQIKKGREKRQRTLVSKSHIGYLCKRKQQQQKKNSRTPLIMKTMPHSNWSQIPTDLSSILFFFHFTALVGYTLTHSLCYPGRIAAVGGFCFFASSNMRFLYFIQQFS